MKVIETRWRGHRFRSRTEARWAVFFDAAGIRFFYEHEGYDLDGVRYLPDFWLPDLKMFFEVKGGEPTPEEFALCERLHRHLRGQCRGFTLRMVGETRGSFGWSGMTNFVGRSDRGLAPTANTTWIPWCTQRQSAATKLHWRRGSSTTRIQD
jgi:hypothetical protein